MARKDPSYDKPSELNELIARYEEHLKKEQSIYLDADQLADIADKYAGDQRFDDAQRAIDYGLRLHPGNTDLLIEQSLLYLDTGQLDKAKEVAFGIKDDSYEVILLRGELLINEGDIEAAEILFQSIRDLNNYDLLADVASLYKDTGNPEPALTWIEDGLLKFPKSEELLLMKAECLASTGETEKAIEAYNQLIDFDPFNADYWNELSKCHLLISDYTQALNAVDFALAANDQSGEAHLIRGHILFNLDRTDEAIEAYLRALKTGSTSPLFGNMFLGLTYNAMEEWAKASEAFKAAIDYMDDDFAGLRSDLYLSRAISLAHLQQYDNALALCELALEEHPLTSEVYLTEGYIHLLHGNLQSAWALWQTALDIAPEVSTWLHISEYLLESNRLSDVRHCLEQAARIDPEANDIQPRLAVINLLLGDEQRFHLHNSLSPSPIDIKELLRFIEELESPKEYKGFWRLIDKWRKGLS